MSRKRTDQFQGETGATDYKTNPEGPHDADEDDRKFSEVMESRFARSQLVPPKVLEPETEQARERELERQEHLHQQRKRANRARRRKR